MAMDFYSMYFWANKISEGQTEIKILKYGGGGEDLH